MPTALLFILKFLGLTLTVYVLSLLGLRQLNRINRQRKYDQHLQDLEKEVHEIYN